MVRVNQAPHVTFGKKDVLHREQWSYTWHNERGVLLQSTWMTVFCVSVHHCQGGLVYTETSGKDAVHTRLCSVSHSTRHRNTFRWTHLKVTFSSRCYLSVILEILEFWGQRTLKQMDYHIWRLKTRIIKILATKVTNLFHIGKTKGNCSILYIVHNSQTITNVPVIYWNNVMQYNRNT